MLTRSQGLSFPDGLDRYLERKGVTVVGRRVKTQVSPKSSVNVPAGCPSESPGAPRCALVLRDADLSCAYTANSRGGDGYSCSHNQGPTMRLVFGAGAESC